MDPLSVTLAVVSLTTAVKDLVELGQKIQESFARVSNNFRRAQRVAEEMQEMVEELKAFCDEHKDTLANMQDFRLALQSLLDKFRSFETSILPLLPQAGGRRRDRLFRGWDAWRNSNKIEGSIVDLQSDIIKVVRRHVMKSTMRTEVKLERIHKETTRGITGAHEGITQGLEVLEVVRRDVSALRLTRAKATMTPLSCESWTAVDEFNRNVISFADSTTSSSAPMLRTPNMITEEIMTAAYIKLQLNSIALAVEKMSELRVSPLNVDGVSNFSLSLVLKPASMNIVHLRHHIVRQVVDIRDILDTNRMHDISIRRAASALNDLAIGLEALKMFPESTLVSKWSITLARLLVDTSGGDEPDFDASLSLYLCNQSSRYGQCGEKIQSLQAAEQAYQISQSLHDEYDDVDFQMLHSDVLLQYAYLVDHSRATKMTIEALHILEGVLGAQSFTRSKSFDEVIQSQSDYLDHLFSSAPSVYPIVTYARALQRMGVCSFKDNLPQVALALHRIAIAIRRKLVVVHGHEYEAGLASALSSLVQGESADCIPQEELVAMADECVELLRALAERNPPRYARDLVTVLSVKATTLQYLKRDDESIATWEEIASLAEQILQDSEMCATVLGNLSCLFRRLQRHDDAVRTGTLAISTSQHGAETQALRYLDLSNDLRYLRRYNESMEAARTSVPLFRRLAMRDPENWMCYLTGALATLARCLVAVGDLPEALIVLRESASMLDNFLETKTENQEVIDRYLLVLFLHLSFGTVLKAEEECLNICSTAVRHVQRMSEIYPQHADITGHVMRTEFYYSYNMFRIGRLQGVQQYIDQCLETWKRKPLEAISQPKVAAWHAMMMMLKSDVLDAQGCTEQALSTNMKAHEIVEQTVAISQPATFSLAIDTMVQEAQLKVRLGNGAEALQVAETALRLSRVKKPDDTSDDLILSLHGVASTALSCQDYQRAAEAAQEACDIYDSDPSTQDIGGEHDAFIPPSLFILLSSSEANLGRYHSAKEYAQRAVNMALDIWEIGGCISVTTAEHTRMETRGNLANILLATGEFTEARQIFEERRIYFSQRAEQRMGDYRELAPILRTLGALYCSEGRHEEGNDTAEELCRILRTLRGAFPSLHEQVKHQLRNQVKFPISKVLNDICQRLDCKHQTGVYRALGIE